jgi:ankyrin repeat protein
MRWIAVSVLACTCVAAGAAQIHDVLESKEPERAKKLIESDPENVDYKGKNDIRPLHIAARRGLLDIAKLLIDKGAAVNAGDAAGETPLHFAAANGQREVVKLLIDKGAKVSTATRFGGTPLHRAAKMGHREIAELLLDKKADVNAKDASGRTPLDAAVESDAKGASAVAELLRKKGGLPGKDVK